jgi:hypothetical protein
LKFTQFFNLFFGFKKQIPEGLISGICILIYLIEFILRVHPKFKHYFVFVTVAGSQYPPGQVQSLATKGTVKSIVQPNELITLTE